MALSKNTQRFPIIFDGSDPQFSFTDFLRRIAWSSDWIAIVASAGNKDMEDFISSRLYGEALRYYESLGPECQQDFEQLRDALSRRFPGVIRNGGIVRHSAIKWDQSGLLTSAEEPPLNASQRGLPPSEKTNNVNLENKLPEKRTSGLLKNLRNAITAPSLPFRRNPLQPSPATPKTPLTIHSFLIEQAHGGTQWKPLSTSPVTTLDLCDEAAVQTAKKIPLAVIRANEAVKLSPKQFQLSRFYNNHVHNVSPFVGKVIVWDLFIQCTLAS